METAAQVTAPAGRKRKISIEESELSTSSANKLKTRLLSAEKSGDSASSAANYVNSTCETDGPDHVSASCCSSNGSSELAKLSSKFTDPEESETAAVGFFATSAGDDPLDCTDRRETTQTRPSGEPGELESTTMLPYDSNSNSHGRSTAQKMPSEAELEDFFISAEKNFQKKFVDKYNFDPVKEQPLEGRYEWVRNP